MHHNYAANPTMRPVSSGKSFVTFCTYKERQDALKNTPIMENNDDKRADSQRSVDSKISNSIHGNGHVGRIATPPPQFADLQRTNSAKPPSSPTPDYDNVQLRGTISKQVHSTDIRPSTQPPNAATISGNRRTMRLGTVTIGEYTGVQNQRKEPAKFDFLAQKKLPDEKSHLSQQDPESLRSELNSTLSRSNLKQTTIQSSDQLEHQSHCTRQRNFEANVAPSVMENEYSNVEKLTRMLQCKQNSSETHMRPMSYQAGRKSVAQQKVESTPVRNEYTGNGILKNGSSSNRSSRSSFNKNAEKSISFGN